MKLALDLQSKTRLCILPKKEFFNASTLSKFWEVNVEKADVYNKAKSDLKIDRSNIKLSMVTMVLTVTGMVTPFALSGKGAYGYTSKRTFTLVRSS